jgi:hypothetical protein
MKTLALTLAVSALATSAFAAGDISAFDRDGDRFASQDEIAAVLPGLTGTDFRRIDANRDNRVSATELATGAAQGVLGRYTGASGVMDLAAVDTNGDNFVDFTELAAAYPGVSPADFRQVDANDDSRLSNVELIAGHAIVARYNPATEAQVTSLAAIDTDGSNFADFSEVVAAYPGLTGPDLRELDLNRDNRISFSELYTGQSILDRK